MTDAPITKAAAPLTARPTAVRAVVCDLDGTLLRGDKTLSSRTRAALQRARHDRIALAVASARPQRMIEDVLGDELDLFDAMLVSNGAAVVHRGDPQPRGEALLAGTHLGEVVTSVQRLWPGAGLGWESGAAFGFDRRFAQLAARQWVVRDMAGAPVAVPPATGVHQLAVLVPDRAPAECLPAALDALGDRVAVTDSHGGVVELSALDADKAGALRRWTALLRLGPEDAVAFGDEHNDLPMLRAAGLGVAVANAREFVRAAADEVTATNDDDGVAATLERLAASGWTR